MESLNKQGSIVPQSYNLHFGYFAVSRNARENIISLHAATCGRVINVFADTDITKPALVYAKAGFFMNLIKRTESVCLVMFMEGGHENGENN